MCSILYTWMYVGWVRARAAVCACVCMCTPLINNWWWCDMESGGKRESMRRALTHTHTHTPFRISGATHTCNKHKHMRSVGKKNRSFHFLFSLVLTFFVFHRISTRTANSKTKKKISAYLFMHNIREFGQRALIFDSNIKRLLWILSERAFQTIAEFQ